MCPISNIPHLPGHHPSALFPLPLSGHKLESSLSEPGGGLASCSSPCRYWPSLDMVPCNTAAVTSLLSS